MNSKVPPAASSARSFKLLTVLIFILFFGLSRAVYAADITYTGDGENLQRSPAWFDEENESCFFPSAKAAPLFSGNKVTVNYNPTILSVMNPGWVFGGLSEHENTADNYVVLLNGVVDYSILGGYSYSGNVTGNRVDISGGSVGGEITGGEITGGCSSVGTDVCGGMSVNGRVMGNMVLINGGAVSGSAYGGQSTEGSVTGNTVLISSGSVDRYLHGGCSDSGNAVDNNVTVSGGDVHEGVIGGISMFGSEATGNTVTINGGSVGLFVMGGMGGDNVTRNTVIVSDGSVGEGVVGGVGSGHVMRNTVIVSGGSIGEGVIGGYSTNSNATDNTVTISDGRPDLAKASILGGQTENASADAFTGNTLNCKSFGISAKGVSNFEYYNFYLPKDLVVGGVMLSITEPIVLKGMAVAVFSQGVSNLREGDKIALIHSAAGVSNAPKNKSCQAQQDGLLYEFSIYIDSNNLWAKLETVSNTAE